MPHADPDDPPRRRADSRRGHGPFETGRPPLAGVVGRESAAVRLDVIETASLVELDDLVDAAGLGGTTGNTDEWSGSNRIGKRPGRVHRTVDHWGPQRTWALDRDGDGVREVHGNRLEGLWTGVRNFLRPFPGVSQWFLAQDVAIFQWGYNLKEVTDEFMRVMLGIPPSTCFPS
jgi:transposase